MASTFIRPSPCRLPAQDPALSVLEPLGILANCWALAFVSGTTANQEL
jgi:hypothetical protein